MARLKSVRAPTTASLPSNLRIPSSTPSLVKAFGKLTRQALLDLAFQWLDDRNLQAFPPYLQEDEDQKEEEGEGPSPYPAERTVNDVRNAYQELQLRKGGKREPWSTFATSTTTPPASDGPHWNSPALKANNNNSNNNNQIPPTYPHVSRASTPQPSSASSSNRSPRS
ncbi:unnamed protein product [Aspergillus niger]|nr:unnamed protein product [Aspergillus niger]